MNLNHYEWNNIKFMDIFRVSSGKTGTKYFQHGRCDIFQLGFKIYGTSDIIYNNKKYCFADKSVLYLPKETSTDIEYHKTISENGESICVFFDSPNTLPTEPVLIQNNDNNDIQIRNMFFELLNAYNQPVRDTFVCMSLFYNILSHLNKKISTNPCGNETKANGIDLNNIILYIQNHICDEYIDFDLLAKNNKISIDHFRHIFKKTYNISPLQYFHKAKINYIKNLLHNSNYSIGDIAALLGFNDLNYFSRFFKKHTGISPSEYRKMCLM